jgi:hypothetical protein
VSGTELVVGPNIIRGESFVAGYHQIGCGCVECFAKKRSHTRDGPTLHQMLVNEVRDVGLLRSSEIV